MNGWKTIESRAIASRTGLWSQGFSSPTVYDAVSSGRITAIALLENCVRDASSSFSHRLYRHIAGRWESRSIALLVTCARKRSRRRFPKAGAVSGSVFTWCRVSRVSSATGICNWKAIALQYSSSVPAWIFASLSVCFLLIHNLHAGLVYSRGRCCCRARFLPGRARTGSDLRPQETDDSQPERRTGSSKG